MNRHVVLIGAVLAALWHFREVAVTANGEGRGILLVTAPVAFAVASLAVYFWFRGQTAD
jgi:hypothetical protein